MNHINWVQQDPDYQTKYHVLTWKSSHFHEPTARQMVNSALHKEGAAFAVSAGQEQAGMPEIGFGPASTVKSGGFGLGHGQEGMIMQDNAAEKGQDSVAISVQAVERQGIEADTQTVLQQSASQQDIIHQNVLQQTMVQGLAIQQAGIQQHGKLYHQEESGSVSERITTVAVGQGNIRNRLKESAAHLQEIYEKQKQKIKKNLFRVKRAEKKPEPPKKPGRTADREETLSMRAQNHYLLDSYDRNGQYHTLGK